MLPNKKDMLRNYKTLETFLVYKVSFLYLHTEISTSTNSVT